MFNREEEPTPSPLSNKIIKLCEDVLAKTESPDTLNKTLQAVSQDMQKSWQDFKEKIEKAGSEHQNLYKPEIGEINNSFLHFQNSLNEIARYLEDKDSNHLLTGKTEIKFSTFRMLRALNAYQSKELMLGPTDIPYVNFLIKSADALKEGKIDLPLFIGMVKEAQKNAQKCIEDAAKKPKVAEINYLIEAYQDHIKAYGEVAGQAQAGDFEAMKPGFEQLAGAAYKLRDALQKLNLKMLTVLPTPSPHVNLMINVTRAFLNLEIPEQVFRQTLATFKLSVERMHREFEMYARVPTSSVAIVEEVAKARKAFELFEQAIRDYDNFLELRNIFLLERAMETLKEAGNVLHQSFVAFQEIAEREGKLPCVKCHHVNPVNLKRCEKCGTPLPQLVEAATISTFSISEQPEGGVAGGEMVMTENLKKLFDAVNQVAEGELPVEEFLEVVDWLDGLMADQMENTGRIPSLDLQKIPANEKETATQVKAVMDQIKNNLLEGLGEFRASLNTLRKFAERGDKNHLIEGVREAWQAAAKAYQSERAAQAIEELRKPGSQAEG